MTAPLRSIEPAEEPGGGGGGGALRVLGSLPQRPDEPMGRAYWNMRRRATEEQILSLASTDDGDDTGDRVAAVNRLLDDLYFIGRETGREARDARDQKATQRTDHAISVAFGDGFRSALETLATPAGLDEAIDRSGGRLAAFVLGLTDNSAKAARKALEHLAEHEAAWRRWASSHGAPVPALEPPGSDHSQRPGQGTGPDQAEEQTP